jgi:two-component system sensor histidine kinase BaeS
MFRITEPSQLLLRRFALVAIAVILAITSALTVAILFMDLPRHDVPPLVQLLVSSSVISLGVGALFIWLSSGRRWGRLSTRLLAAHGIGMIVMAVNVIVAAYAMFISTHDLSLLTLLLAYSVAMAAIYSVLVSTSIGASLRALTNAARRMSAGDLTARVPIAPERELAELGSAFNTMAERLEMAFRRQRELEEARQGLIAAVSHDLRTPLSSLRVMVEAINDGVASDPATVQRYIKAMERETVSLGRLIDDLFEMARLDAGQVQLRLRPNPISNIIQEALESLGAQAARQGVALSASPNPMIAPVLVDPDRIQRVLYNLIQNAIRHTPADGTVFVEVFDRGPEVQVSVRDTGEGIPPVDLPHVFDRFYRGDKARSRDSAAGAGLGLSIARRLVETHGGRIWVAQPPEGGSIFSFTLPKAVISR